MKKGFINLIVANFGFDILQILKTCKEKCDYLIIGIPDDDYLYRILDRPPQVSFSDRKEFLESFKFVDEIFPLSLEVFSKNVILEKKPFDILFLAENYELPLEENKWLKNKNIEIAIINNFSLPLKNHTLYEALQNTFFNKKIILFGTGNYFNSYMKIYGEAFPPAYAVDNNAEKINKIIQGIKIFEPNVITKEDKNNIVIIICCKNPNPIINQIRQYGDYNFRTIAQNDEISLLSEYEQILLKEKEYLSESHRMLKILIKEFISVCNKYNLKYYLTCGGLLGAVRHKSFIPWDDDIDFSIPYQTYEFLRKNAKDIWKDSEFEFVDFDQLGKNTFVDFIARIIYKGESIENRILNKGNVRSDIKNHLCLDLFVIHNASKNKNKHRRRIIFIDLLYALAMGHRAYIDYAEYSSVPKIQLFGLRIVNTIGKIIPLKLIFNLFRGTANYAANEDTPDCFESNVSIKVVPQLFKWEQYGEGTKLYIDDVEVNVPSQYESWLLTRGYIDYMTPPPPNQRKPFHATNAKGVVGY